MTEYELADAMLAVVEEVYRLPARSLVSRKPHSRTRQFVDATWAVMLALRRLGYSQPMVGRVLGVDHSTVHNAERSVLRARMEANDQTFSAALAACLRVARTEGRSIESERAAARARAEDIRAFAKATRALAAQLVEASRALEQQASRFAAALDEYAPPPSQKK